MSNKNTETESGTIVQERLKKPSLYNVLLLNDDFTPMDFVVLILKTIFSKDEFSAHQIMMQVHNEGKGLAGTYPFDIAETKVVQVLDLSKKNQHPLKCVMEKDS